MPCFKDFPKGDARRYFVVLLAADKLKEYASLQYLAIEAECTRAEIQRALAVLELQFGVQFRRQGSAYLIQSWGVLKKTVVQQLVKKDWQAVN